MILHRSGKLKNPGFIPGFLRQSVLDKFMINGHRLGPQYDIKVNGCYTSSNTTFVVFSFLSVLPWEFFSVQNIYLQPPHGLLHEAFHKYGKHASLLFQD